MKQQKGIYSVTSPLQFGSVCPMDSVALISAYAPNIRDLYPFVQLDRQPWDCSLAALIVCVVNGLRISEVLNLTLGDKLKDGSVIVKGRKGSNSRRILLPHNAWHNWAWRVENPLLPLFPTNYGKVYRAAERVGLRVKFKGYMRARVTHLGRHGVADMLSETGNSEAVQSCLGHKSANSGDWYKKQVDLEKDRNRKRRQREAQKRESANTQ